MDFHAYIREHVPRLALEREPEIVDELAQHLADLYQESIAAGCPHDEAVARAAAALPRYPEDLGREIDRAAHSLPGLIVTRWHSSLAESDPLPSGRFTMLNDLRRDVHYAFRTLIHTPGFALVVALTMALGIGANAVIFTAIDALLLRSAPVADPERVVSVYTSSSDAAPFSTSSYPDYVDLRDSGVFEGLASFAGIQVVFDTGHESMLLTGELVSGNYFSVLGVPITTGRSFSADEDRPGAQVRVAVITHEFWTNRLGGDPSAVGRPITLSGERYTIVGITPRTFISPVLGRVPEIYAPMALQRDLRPPSAGVRRALGHSDLLSVRGVRWLNMIGRLRDEQTLQDASAAADVISSRLATSSPDSNQGRRFSILRLGDGPGVRTSVRPLLRLLGGAVVIVLAIACANVASLLLARSVSRRREVAVRMALGAGRGRLVRQWLTEAVVLSMFGAAGAIVLTFWAEPLFHRLGIPQSVDLGVNATVLTFTLAVALASGLLFGLAPVVQTMRADTLAALRDEGSAVATGVRAARLRSAFVVVQVALSLMLLVGAGLFLRTLHNAYSVDLGYTLENTLLADINLDVRGYSQKTGQTMYARILERVQALPGVKAVGASRVPVLSGNARSATISSDGRPLDRTRRNFLTVRLNTISDGYLPMMGIPVLLGRNFDAADDGTAPPVAIVSRSLARQLWPEADPIGRSLVTGSGSMMVVGMVPDSVYANALERNPPPFFYVPLKQSYESGITLHVSTHGEPLALVPSLRQAIRELDSQLVLVRPRTLEETFVSSIDQQRMMAMLVGLFGAVALVLAAVGLYGMMAHQTTQRTTEMGIRLALGAKRSSIMKLVVGQGLRLFAIGAILGVAGALAASRLVEAQLFGVAPTDPSIFVVVVALLTAVSGLACAVPAHRAMRTDPLTALRH